MTQQEQQINTFLVDVFNDVLRLEEEHLRQPDGRLTVTEIHVLEAVQAGGANASMQQLAARLGVTASTLTVAVKTLERKGYLVRLRPLPDKRRVVVQLTEPALRALDAHARFHERMVRQASAGLPEPELRLLCQALGRLHSFFAQCPAAGAEPAGPAARTVKQERRKTR